jgi:hypothetical protein
MNKQQLFDELQKELNEKAAIYVKADEDLVEEPVSMDAKVLLSYVNAKSSWQQAWNNYFSFLALNKNFKPDSL